MQKRAKVDSKSRLSFAPQLPRPRRLVSLFISFFSLFFSLFFLFPFSPFYELCQRERSSFRHGKHIGSSQRAAPLRPTRFSFLFLLPLSLSISLSFSLFLLFFPLLLLLPSISSFSSSSICSFSSSSFSSSSPSSFISFDYHSSVSILASKIIV